MSAFDYVISLVDRVSAPARTAAGAIAGLDKSVGGLGDAMKGLDEIFPGLGEALGAVAEQAAIAGAALAAIVIGGAALAISANDFKGDAIDALSLVLESSDAAADTFDRLQDIAKTTTLSDAKVQRTALDLLEAGVADGAQLEATVRSIAELTAVNGDRAAGKLETIIERAGTAGKFTLSAKQLTGTGVRLSEVIEQVAQRTGHSLAQTAIDLKKGGVDVSAGIDGLNAAVGNKLGGYAAKQLNDLPVQVARLGENFKRLFQDVQTGPFLDALAKVASLFDDSSDTAKALKTIIEGTFQPIFDAATQALPYVKIALQEAAIAALEVYIGLRPAFSELGKLLGAGPDVDAFSQIMRGVGVAIDYVVRFFVPLIEATVKLLEGFVKLEGYIAGPFGAVLKALGGQAAAAAGSLTEAGQAAGGGFAAGLQTGIEGGAARVAAAAAELGGVTEKATKAKLQISSPSRVMAELGAFTAEGFAMGLESGHADAADAMGGLTSPSPSAAAKSSGATSRSVSIGAITIHVPPEAAKHGAGEIGESVASQLAAMLEQMQIQGGA